MASGRRSTLRDITGIANTYGFDFDGVTGKGHYRWRHRLTGRIAFTVSNAGQTRSYLNTVRQFRNVLRQLNIREPTA